MKTRKVKRILSILALSATFSSLWAQEQPAKPDKPAAKPEAKKDEPETPPQYNKLSINAYGWNIGGNRQRFDQYAEPAHGLTGDLSLFSQLEGNNKPWSHGVLRGNSSDYVGAGSVEFDRGRAWIGGFADRFSFSDPTIFPTEPSTDHRGQVETWYKLRSDLGLFASYRTIARELNFEPPLPAYDYTTARYAVGAQGNMLGGNAGVSFDGNTFNDRTNLQPDWTRNRIQAFWGRELTDRLSAEANYARTNIVQAGLTDGKVETYGADFSFDLTNRSTLFFNLKHQDNTLPNVQNAYVQRRVDATGRYLGYLGKSRLDFSVRHTEEKRLNADHTFLDIPVWNTFDLRLAGRNGHQVSYVAKLNWQHFNKGDIFDLSDPLSLYWDDRIRAQARIDGGGDRYTWYASQGFGLNRNATRDVLIRSYNSNIGGAYAVAPTSTALLDLSVDSYAIQGAEDPNGLSLSQFFPNDVSITAGFDKALTKSSNLLVNLNHTFTNYENPMLLPNGNTRTTQLTAQYRRRLGADSSFGLYLAPWAFQDKLYNQYGYRATMFGLNYSKKF